MSYQNDIEKFKLLSKEEEKNLFIIYNGDDKKESEKAFNKLVNHNLYNVKIIVDNAGFRNHSHRNDLVSEGNIALMKAIGTYDNNKHESRFVSYLRVCVLNKIARFFILFKNIIRIPAHQALKYNKISKYDEMSIAIRALDLTPLEVELYLRFKALQPEHLDGLTSVKNSSVFKDERPLLFNDPNDDDKIFIQELFKFLKPIEVEVVTKCYGLDGNKPMTNRAVAKEKGWSDTKAANIKLGAIKKLKTFMNREDFNI